MIKNIYSVYIKHAQQCNKNTSPHILGCRQTIFLALHLNGWYDGDSGAEDSPAKSSFSKWDCAVASSCTSSSPVSSRFEADETRHRIYASHECYIIYILSINHHDWIIASAKKGVSICACLIVCRSVGLSAGLHKNCRTDCHQTRMADGSQLGIDPGNSWCGSGQRDRSRNVFSLSLRMWDFATNNGWIFKQLVSMTEYKKGPSAVLVISLLLLPECAAGWGDAAFNFLIYHWQFTLQQFTLFSELM